ncbi:MAG TPA: molybdate ABC transporter substrate-binding protein [Acidimicrobiia bacterium]|nr:molybdate ABC transporter substrate-binding protein [Acidimicrobiia bacterium]
MSPKAVSLLLGIVLATVACRSDANALDGALTGDQSLLVAGASDLRPAFEEIAALFTARTGHEIVFDFGSSGQLAQRIVEGAPVDVYASANVSYVREVLASGRGDPATTATYAFGRIVIWSRTDQWNGWETPEDLAADPDLRFLAIANPDHAPYGLAARQALESVGVWEDLEPTLVFGENISDTKRLADTGDADAALIALSLAIAAGGQGEWALVDEALHEPLEQALVVITEDPGRKPAAAAFAGFVNGPEGREVMTRYGFVLPDEGAP